MKGYYSFKPPGVYIIGQINKPKNVNGKVTIQPQNLVGMLIA